MVSGNPRPYSIYLRCALVALVIQHSVRMRRIILSSVACPPLYNIFPHYFINGTTFGKTLLHIKYIFIFSITFFSETFLILRKTEGDTIINVYRYS